MTFSHDTGQVIVDNSLGEANVSSFEFLSFDENFELIPIKDANRYQGMHYICSVLVSVCAFIPLSTCMLYQWWRPSCCMTGPSPASMTRRTPGSCTSSPGPRTQTSSGDLWLVESWSRDQGAHLLLVLRFLLDHKKRSIKTAYGCVRLLDQQAEVLTRYRVSHSCVLWTRYRVFHQNLQRRFWPRQQSQEMWVWFGGSSAEEVDEQRVGWHRYSDTRYSEKVLTFTFSL